MSGGAGLKRLFWVGALVILLCGTTSGWGKELALFQDEALQGEPWTLKADNLVYEANTQTYEATGKVVIRQGDRRITADAVQVNVQTKVARLQGNVVIVLEEDILTGQSGQFNLATQSGEMTDARLFVKKNNFHVNAGLMRKTGENTYHAERAVITTCDADRPVWSFYSREIDVTLEGYATSVNTVMRLGPVPVMYLPYAVLPVKTTRQSGLLMPQYGQHRAGGSVVELPLFWAINNYMDATLYPMLISSRGFLSAGEYRYAASKSSGGTIRGGYIRDGKDDTPTPHRYFLEGMVNQELAPGLWAKGTVDMTSDFRYLRDFNFGYLGLNRYSQTLLDDYGRNLEQDDVKTRVSNLVLSKNFSQANLSFFGNYYQRLLSNDPRPFNKAPSLNLTTMLLPVFRDWPVHLDLDSAYTHYYQNLGLTGQRLELHPKLSVSPRLFGALDLYGRIGFRETAWRVDNHGDQGQLPDWQSRQLYDVKTGVGTSIFRDYGRDAGAGKYIRHVLQPQVLYWQSPRFNPGNFPWFDPRDLSWITFVNRNLPILDGYEPLGSVNALTYSLSNHILYRYTSAGGLPQTTELLWFRLSHSTFFNTTTIGLDGTNLRHNRFSDILAEVQLSPVRYLSVGFDLGTSPYREGFNRVDLKFSLHDAKWRNFLHVDYLYLKNYANQINSQVFVDLFNSFKVGVTNQHTFITDKQLETNYGIIFQRQCWGVSLNYADRSDDKRITFTLFIPGLIEKLPRGPMRQQVPRLTRDEYPEYLN